MEKPICFGSRGTGRITLSDEELCRRFSGPLLLDYVWWVLREAEKRKLRTLYFLARDGYLLYRIAQVFVSRYSLPLECRYFYCSRTSLRMPSYWFIGEEAFDLLLCNSYRMTLETLFQRAECSEEEKEAVCKDCGLLHQDRRKLLSKAEWNEIGKRLRESPVFQDFIRTKSRRAYEPAIAYFRQEGLFSKETIALVDSGWGGSIQRSMRQLLASAGYSGSLVGFYFGMFEQPKSTEDGEYLTWYFHARGQTLRKIPFNPNLFECLLAAPHGMTVCYEKTGEKICPVLCQSEMTQEGMERINAHIRLVVEFAEHRLQNIPFSSFYEEKASAKARKLVWRYMAHPTQEEAEYYGNLLFCDDISDSYQMKLADASQQDKLKSYFIIPRIVRKVFSRQKARTGCDLFWPCGTISFLPRWKRPWYRWNFIIWEWIRYLRQK